MFRQNPFEFLQRLIPSGMRFDSDLFRLQFKENPFSFVVRVAREKLHLQPGQLTTLPKLELRFEMTRARAIQLAAAAAILLLSCTVTYYNWDSIQTLFGATPPDRTVTSWVQDQPVGHNPDKPISATNPVDPEQSMVITNFACRGGKLLITERPNDAVSQPEIKYVPDRRVVKGRAFQVYHDQLSRVIQIKDEAREAIAYTAYIEGQDNIDLVKNAGLTPDQQKDVNAAHTKMLDAISLVNSKVVDGTFDSRLFQEILDQVAKYKSNPGDPLKNVQKQKMAQQIMMMGMKFITEIDGAKAAVIDNYVDTVDQLLQSDQRQKLADGAHNYLSACAPALGNPVTKSS